MAALCAPVRNKNSKSARSAPSGACTGRAGRDGANGEYHNPVLALRFPLVLVRAVEKFFNRGGSPPNGEVLTLSPY